MKTLPIFILKIFQVRSKEVARGVKKDIDVIGRTRNYEFNKKY